MSEVPLYGRENTGLPPAFSSSANNEELSEINFTRKARASIETLIGQIARTRNADAQRRWGIICVRVPKVAFSPKVTSKMSLLVESHIESVTLGEKHIENVTFGTRTPKMSHLCVASAFLGRAI